MEKVVTLVPLILLLILVAFFIFDRGFNGTKKEDSNWLEQSKSMESWPQIRGYKLHVLDTYTKNTKEHKPAIILLHGWNDSTFSYSKILPILAKKYRVIAFDWPGFGYSDKPDHAIGYKEFALIIKELMDKLQIKRAFLLGNSMGGGAALQMAADFPQMVYGVIALDAHVDELKNRKTPPLILQLLLADYVGEIGAFLTSKFSFRLTLKEINYDNSVITDEMVKEMYLPLDYQNGRRSMILQLREINNNPVSFRTAHKITAPALVVWGRKDKWISLKIGKQLKLWIDNSRLKILEDTGHCPQWERPKELAKLVEDFISEVGPSEAL